MTVDNVKPEHSFTAYNESLTINQGGEKARISSDFKHLIFKDKEYVEIDGKTVPFHRSNFPFDLNDIRFTKNIENEKLLINGKEQTLRLVYHIQIGETEYVLLDGEYQEYNSLKPESPGETTESFPHEMKQERWKDKKIILALAGVVLVISVAVIFSAIAGSPESADQYTTDETQSNFISSKPEITPEPTIPGYFEETYAWKSIRTDYSSSGRIYSYLDRDWTMSISISRNSYYKSKNSDHSGRIPSVYVNDSFSQEAVKQVADKIMESGKKYGYGNFENAMNAASFVQNGLPYTEDIATTGSAEYWRYPVETLVDGGGDCEDSAILLASILQNMGYEVIVLILPEHAAVAIKDVINPTCGSWSQIEYNGEKYLFIETTDSCEIGYIPYDYYGEDALVG